VLRTATVIKRRWSTNHAHYHQFYAAKLPFKNSSEGREQMLMQSVLLRYRTTVNVLTPSTPAVLNAAVRRVQRHTV